jgi:nucleoside-diphosphate-sugar epimerase
MEAALGVAPELCIHCAWYTEPGKYLSSSKNVDLAYGTAKFASALARAGCQRFVGLGTCFEYDTNVGYLSEKTPLAPAHAYSAAKAATYFLVRELSAGTQMSFAWARLFYLFGPNEHRNRLVPAVVNALLRGEEARVTPGEQVRDFLHVDDVASALCAIARSDVTDAVNVGSGEPITVASLVLKIGAILGRPELIRLGAREYSSGDPMFVCADNRKLRATGWVRKYSLEEGLRQTIRTGHRSAPLAGGLP